MDVKMTPQAFRDNTINKLLQEPLLKEIYNDVVQTMLDASNEGKFNCSYRCVNPTPNLTEIFNILTYQGFNVQMLKDDWDITLLISWR